MDKLKIGSPEMKEAGRIAQAILDLYESGKLTWKRCSSGYSTHGSCCLLGAEAVVGGKTSDRMYDIQDGLGTPFRRCFTSRLPMTTTSVTWPAVSFNDKPGRTYAQVKAALKHIIAASKREPKTRPIAPSLRDGRSKREPKASR